MTGAAWRLAMAAKEPDQAGRLRRFRDEHPAVDICPGDFRTLHAWIPAGNGSGREIVRHTLRELLDELDTAFPPEDSGRGPHPPGAAPGSDQPALRPG